MMTGTVETEIVEIEIVTMIVEEDAIMTVHITMTVGTIGMMVIEEVIAADQTMTLGVMEVTVVTTGIGTTVVVVITVVMDMDLEIAVIIAEMVLIVIRVEAILEIVHRQKDSGVKKISLA